MFESYLFNYFYFSEFVLLDRNLTLDEQVKIQR